MRELVPGALDGERVDRAVALLTGLTRAEVTELIDAGGVHLAGRPVTVRARRVHTGQQLDVEVPERLAAPAALVGDDRVAFVVVHVDSDLLVIDKPAGLVVHPGNGNREGTLVHGLLARYPDLADLADAGAEHRPGIVHRLDKGTSGLLLVARSAFARKALIAQLAGREVERRYATVVVGTLDADEGIIDAPLGRSTKDPTRVAVHAGGRAARTRYRVEGRYTAPTDATLLECRLETGRTHQIRVHLAAIGHPVLGDPRYGGPYDPGGWHPLGPERPFLHARALAFDHPRTGERLQFASPLPTDLAGVLDQLS